MSSARERAGRELTSLCARVFGVRKIDGARLIVHAEARARARSMELSEYLARLQTDAAEQSAFAAVATNGWTWVWREAQALADACERLASRSSRRAHAWVAGCSTGEEALTLAIIAARSGLDISILATDVDESRIAHARAGRYEEQTLRHLPPELRERFFRREGRHWQPVDALAARLRFGVHNLLSAPPAPATGEWDLVSCRNVVLHADGPSARRMLANLSSVLDPFGERVLSAADELAVDEYRLARRVPSMRPPPSPGPPADRPHVVAPMGAQLEQDARELDSLLTLGNRHLACHRLEEAGLAYAAAEAIEPQSAELLIMQGLLHRKAGRAEEAEGVIRRALFLEPDLWLGWLLLAGIYERAGLWTRARRALETALHALNRRPRLKWRAADCGILDRRVDAETARRLCHARLDSNMGLERK